MKMSTAVCLLQQLPVRPEKAITVAEIAAKLHPDGDLSRNALRSFYRYVNELAAESEDGPALLEVIDGEPRRYYLKLSSVAEWFMTEEVALNVLLTGQVIGKALGSVGPLSTERLSDIAETIAGASLKTKRIRKSVRVVPDWIGRLPARIDPQVLQAAIDALGDNQKLQIDYTNHHGAQSKHLLSPQGLVAKDGTVYLLATSGIENRVRHFPLHRVRSAFVHSHPLQVLPGFNLDCYIEESHQLSHPLDVDAAPVVLKLRVAPETIYHFSERPLSKDQTIILQSGMGGWFLVTATVPETILLIPFLLSMGGWIEVLEPADVRDETARRLSSAAAHYVP